MFAQYFEYYAIILRGAVFLWTSVYIMVLHVFTFSMLYITHAIHVAYIYFVGALQMTINLVVCYRCLWSLLPVWSSVHCWQVSTYCGSPSWRASLAASTCTSADIVQGGRYCLWLYPRHRPVISETGSSNISAADWDISPKLQPTQMSEVTKKAKPEVELRCRGRHLRKWIWRYKYVADGSIWT